MSDDLDVELLRDKPTLFFSELREFLSEDDALQVLSVLGKVCNHCWDSWTPCNCERDD